ncbi:MAG: hypothetical protein ACLQAT_22835 [Candidatus Binataceae bacterium]
MSTDKQIAANQLNAQKSTGPRTPAGKERASANACKHGLSGRDLAMPDEKPYAYDSFRAGLLASLAPHGALEAMLADRIVSHAWRLRRVPIIEAGLCHRSYHEIRARQIAREVDKLQASDDVKLFEARRLLRVTDEIAYVSAQRRLRDETEELQDISSQVIDAFTAASATLVNLGRHEAVLSRSLLQTLHELQRLQAARAGQNVPAPAVVDLNLTPAPPIDQPDPQS